MPTTVLLRRSAEGRREEVLQAALIEFAAGGMGVSTESIARRAGISQPYLFRLFGTKRDLFIAAVERCFTHLREVFVRAAGGLSGTAATEALGRAYGELLAADPGFLRMQLQAYTCSTDDPAIRAATLRGFTELWETVVGLTGITAPEARAFFAEGMLWNVTASLGLAPGGSEPLVARLFGTHGHLDRPGSTC